MSDKSFTKENLDSYLKELAKEYRKLNKKMPAEIILIGGASVLINYGFREKRYDIDAIIEASSAMKDAINIVGDRYNLPNGWLNTDFIKTSSYTPNIIKYSKYYRTFSNVVTFRTITGEYLVAMKLMAGRQYKYDMSDVVGILWEHEKRADALTLERIKAAVSNLYGSYDKLPLRSREFIEDAVMKSDYESFYKTVREREKETKGMLSKFQDDYPGVITPDNVNEIIDLTRKKINQSPP